MAALLQRNKQRKRIKYQNSNVVNGNNIRILKNIYLLKFYPTLRPISNSEA